jgi:hypothetical protein
MYSRSKQRKTLENMTVMCPLSSVLVRSQATKPPFSESTMPKTKSANDGHRLRPATVRASPQTLSGVEEGVGRRPNGVNRNENVPSRNNACAIAPSGTRITAKAPTVSPTPILKRATSRYSKAIDNCPVVFEVVEEKPSKHSATVLIIKYRVSTVPRMRELYDAVAAQIGVPADLFCLFFGVVGENAKEVLSDGDVAQCISESAQSDMPKLTVVVTDVGILGRVCLSIGGTALAWYQAGRVAWRGLGGTLRRNSGPPASPARSPRSIYMSLQSHLGAPCTVAVAVTGLTVVVVSCSFLLDRVRTGTPRMAYRPTRHLVALTKACTTIMRPTGHGHMA